MKKVILAAFAALLGVAVSAQDFSITDEGSAAEASTKSWSTWSSDSSFGWGYHVMLDGDADFLSATPSFGKNREIFFTLLGGELRPVKFAGLSFGVDLNWDAYRLNSQHYWSPSDGKVEIKPVEGNFQQVKKSVLRSFGIDIPVQLKLHIGNICLAGGVVGELNFPGRTKFQGITNDGGSLKNGPMRVKDIKSLPFTYSYRAAITYDHIGLYGKYSPCSQFEPGFGPQFSYWTIGLIFW